MPCCWRLLLQQRETRLGLLLLDAAEDVQVIAGCYSTAKTTHALLMARVPLCDLCYVEQCGMGSNATKEGERAHISHQQLSAEFSSEGSR